MTLQDYLARLEKLDKDATNGPWTACECKIYALKRELPSMQMLASLDNVGASGDQHFIAEARSALPKLVRLLRIIDEHIVFGAYLRETCEGIVNE